MTIKQLSVFAENKNGALYSVASVLADAGINIHAFSVADTEQFGVLRLIVSDTKKAKEQLTAAGMVVSLTDVIAAEIPDSPGGLAAVLRVIKNHDIPVEYMYAFVSPSDTAAAYVVLRVDNNDRAASILQAAGVTLIGEDKVSRF